jgi:predicted glycosyltransferase
MRSQPTLLCYCQHSVGLGHLTRSYALCDALTERFRVVLLCGGALPEGIAPPPGVELVALPPLGVGPEGAFVSHDPRYTVEQAWTARLERILAAFRDVRPDVVLVELFPFGRAKFARELVPLLEEARAAGAFTACSLRDILVSGRANQQFFDDRACALANAHLDTVLVHSDPRFARLEETFRPRRALRVPVRYTGFVVRDAARPAFAPARRGAVVVSAGGGLVGEPLLRTAVKAQRRLWRRTGVPMRVVAGPLLPEPEWQDLQQLAAGQPGLELRRSVPDLGAELTDARASVSQGGYNTALEVVRSGVPGLLVPYATEEEDEQTRRARRLERIGAVRVLDAVRLTPAGLAGEIERLLAFRPRRTRVDLDGARSSGRVLTELLSASVDAVPATGASSA